MEARSASSINQLLWSCTGDLGHVGYHACMMLGPLSFIKGLSCTVVSSLHALDTAVMRRPVVHCNMVSIDQGRKTALQFKWTRCKLSHVQEVYNMSAHLWMSLLHKASLIQAFHKRSAKVRHFRGDCCLCAWELRSSIRGSCSA